MFTAIHPKIPMRNINITRKFYIDKLGFQERGKEVVGFDGYLILTKDQIELHFFEFKSLDPKENYGQIYIRCQDIDQQYEELLERNVEIHPNGALRKKSWGVREFAILDPDMNLITFGQDH
jgi:catechol 2,3-dioxygenase-like lactoylglutathione lyase family enzyme